MPWSTPGSWISSTASDGWGRKAGRYTISHSDSDSDSDSDCRDELDRFFYFLKMWNINSGQIKSLVVKKFKMTLFLTLNGVTCTWDDICACLQVEAAGLRKQVTVTSPSSSYTPSSSSSGSSVYERQQKRKLASIQYIEEVQTIVGADDVVIARMYGLEWTCVVSKGEFAPGDMVVFFEIDAVVPVWPCFEYLRPTNCYVHCEKHENENESENGGEGFRVTTRAIHGILSQGLMVPLKELTSPASGLVNLAVPSSASTGVDLERVLGITTSTDLFMLLGLDVTAALGVHKYERLDTSSQPTIPIPIPAGKFPFFLQKTGQEHIQNCFKKIHVRRTVREAMAVLCATKAEEELFEVTLKLDGTSCTAFSFKGETGVCSRSILLKSGSDGGIYTRVGEPIAEALQARGLDLGIQFEILCPGIGTKCERLLSPRAYVFDVWDIADQAYWSAPRRHALCAELGLSHVPVLADVVSLDSFPSVGDILAFADHPSITHADAEGVVFKSLLDPSVSFKAVSQIKCN